MQVNVGYVGQVFELPVQVLPLLLLEVKVVSLTARAETGKGVNPPVVESRVSVGSGVEHHGHSLRLVSFGVDFESVRPQNLAVTPSEDKDLIAARVCCHP